MDEPHWVLKLEHFLRIAAKGRKDSAICSRVHGCTGGKIGSSHWVHESLRLGSFAVLSFHRHWESSMAFWWKSVSVVSVVHCPLPHVTRSQTFNSSQLQLYRLCFTSALSFTSDKCQPSIVLLVSSKKWVWSLCKCLCVVWMQAICLDPSHLSRVIFGSYFYQTSTNDCIWLLLLFLQQQHWMTLEMSLCHVPA